jgi:tRNA 2-selenouridine synthase SelU
VVSELSKVLLSVTTAFAESRTLDTGIHSTKGGSRQRVVSRRLKLTVVTFVESRVLAVRKEFSLPSAPRLTLDRASFVECPCWTLGKEAVVSELSKVLLSVTMAFAESRTLDTGIHSVKGGSRQRVVSRRLKLTAVTFAENRVLALRKEFSSLSAPRLTLDRASFAECPRWTLGKVYFYFYFANQTFCGMFLHYVDLHVPFYDNYKSVFYNY